MADDVELLLLIWKYACQKHTHQHTQYLAFCKLHLPTLCCGVLPASLSLMAFWQGDFWSSAFIYHLGASSVNRNMGHHFYQFIGFSLDNEQLWKVCADNLVIYLQQRWPNSYTISKNHSILVMSKKILWQLHFSTGHVIQIVLYLRRL